MLYHQFIIYINVPVVKELSPAWWLFPIIPACRQAKEKDQVPTQPGQFSSLARFVSKERKEKA